MKLPYLGSSPGRSQQQIVTFGGIHYGEGASSGELEESIGLSSARFPCLSQREGRKTFATYTSPTGLYARGALCVVDGTDFLYDSRIIGTVTAGEKQFATINTKIVIFPDKKYYDTTTGEFGSLEANYTVYPGTLTFTDSVITIPAACYYDAETEDGSIPNVVAVKAFTVYASANINVSTGVLTLGASSSKTAATLAVGDIITDDCETGKYKVISYCALQSDDTYLIQYKLHASTLHSYPALNTVFNLGDAVEISGCGSVPANNKTAIVRKITATTMTFYSGTLTAGSETWKVALKRTVPNLSCICECDNRIWGAAGQTIYASALGDPKNFNVYDGLSTDSFAVAVGTDGDFTGCIAYSSSVIFWKEHCYHKIMGSVPSDYSYNTYTVPGLQAGSEKSMVIINEVLYYKGRGGIYAFTGGTPELISENFGTRRYTDAVAGTDGESYYISVSDERGEWSLFVYDTLLGIWLREDATHASDFASLDGVLYYLDHITKKVMMTGQDYSEEGRIDWTASFAPFTEQAQGRKCYSKLYLRLELTDGAWMQVLISCDGEPWHKVWSTHDSAEPALTAYFRPTRCDSFRVRLAGKGQVKIKSFVREFETGSEV
ncbi:MAG: hypothetical protein RR365_04030 [Bacteroides sp.]